MVRAPTVLLVNSILAPAAHLRVYVRAAQLTTTLQLLVLHARFVLLGIPLPALVKLLVTLALVVIPVLSLVHALLLLARVVLQVLL